jgi:hypothetical protein
VLFKKILSVEFLTKIINVQNATLVISSIRTEYAKLQILSAKKSTQMALAKVAMMATN